MRLHQRDHLWKRPLKLELKDLLPHLRYAFLGMNKTLLLIIEVDLSGRQVKCLMDSSELLGGLLQILSESIRYLFSQNLSHDGS